MRNDSRMQRFGVFVTLGTAEADDTRKQRNKIRSGAEVLSVMT